MILRKIMNLSHRSPHIVYFIRKTKLKNQKMTQSLLEHLVEMEFWLTIMTIEQQIQTRRIRTTTKVHRTSVIAHQLQIPMAQACSALIRATWDRFKRITVANLIITMIFQAWVLAEKCWKTYRRKVGVVSYNDLWQIYAEKNKPPIGLQFFQMLTVKPQTEIFWVSFTGNCIN